MQSSKIPERAAQGAAVRDRSRYLVAARFWLAQLSISGIIASGAQADVGRDYSLLVLAHVPSLCAMRDMSVLRALSGTAANGQVRTLMVPNQYRIICNVPFAVRVGRLQYDEAAARVSPMSEARPPPLEVSLTAWKRFGVERVTCAGATRAEATSCTLFGRSAAHGRTAQHPASRFSIGWTVPEAGARPAAGGALVDTNARGDISVALTPRY